MTFPDQIIYSYLIKWNHITDIQASRYYQHNWSISPSNNNKPISIKVSLTFEAYLYVQLNKRCLKPDKATFN